jgi:hypothetical protein
MRLNYFAGWCFVFFVFVSLAGAQAPGLDRGEAAQWEYLVVLYQAEGSFMPTIERELREPGGSKLLLFAQSGAERAREAHRTQSSMDVLGRFGWELIGVLGTPGNEMQMMFKRPFDQFRSNNEANELQKLISAEQTAPASALVDLDAFDRNAGRDANRQKQIDRLKMAASSVPGLVAENVVSYATATEDINVGGVFVVDGTALLLSDGSKYRASEAQRLANEKLSELISAANVMPGPVRLASGTLVSENVRLQVNVTIDHGGEKKVVAIARRGGVWQH